MEGVYDGAASDDCFLCGLLFPDRYRDDCPRCHRRMRYQPAVQMDSLTLESNVIATAQRYQSAPSTDVAKRLEELLVLLHRFAPESLTALASATQLQLPELRERWQSASESP